MRDLVIDDVDFTAAMERYHALLRDASPLMGIIAQEMHEAVETNFAAQGRPKWLGLSPKTLRNRREAAGSGKILQLSGRLAASIVPRHDATTARVGTNVVYAAIHQFGGSIERHPMSGYVRLRKDRNGALLRQQGHKHLAVFAKDSHKRVKVVKWTRSQGWTIKIPARPFLVLTESDCLGIEGTVSDFLRRLFDH
ncbi:phage virion morphogenesis protein [Pandoraea sp. SD6-2]|uniref:phage virion morphogenesis protein n=1 Tax=Pandoraea sp. SD6-2 TaxID=1286093 RepID=UPI00032F2811|nr:phage virion morphogenesis protein [Pandoraea sp. SD6-2]EON13079.1 phage virion morphogenesis protein [Pandoraea sp. SD6-2]